MADRKYTIGRPQQDVRLRNWPAGRVAQFKNAVQMLEEQLNAAMASQISQGTKRVFSSRVPKVVNVSIRAGYKNFQISFDEAKGISDLLFYEIQLDTSSGFPNPSTYTIPQTTLTIPSDGTRQRVYVRVRVMNSKFEVGPWSNSAAATGSSNLRISVFRTDESETTITTSQFRDQGESDPEAGWVDVGGANYSPTSAAMCLHIHAGAYIPIHTAIHQRPGASQQEDTWYAVIEFRVLKNGTAIQEAGKLRIFGTAEQRNNGGEGLDDLQRTEVMVIGTLVTPFETFVGNEATQEYTLQARVLTIADSDQTDIVVKVSAIDILEVLQAV